MANKSQPGSLKLAPQQTQDNFNIVGVKMMEMFKNKGREDPRGAALECVSLGKLELEASLVASDHGVHWATKEPRVVSAQYYTEQLTKLVWIKCCSQCSIPNAEAPPLPVKLQLTDKNMYGEPSAPEHVLWMEENRPQQPKEVEEPKAEQSALKPPAPPSQPAAAVPKKTAEEAPGCELPLHRKKKQQTVAMDRQIKMQSFTTKAHEDKVARQEEKLQGEARFFKEQEKKGVDKEQAMLKANQVGQSTYIETEKDRDGKRVVKSVEVTNLSVPKEEADKGKKPEEGNKTAPEPSAQRPRSIVFPNDASNTRIKEAQDSKKAEQLREISASATKPPAGPSKTEAKPSAPADKAPTYYREWYKGIKGNECKMSLTNEHEDWDTDKMKAIWDKFFAPKGIKAPTGTEFEVRIPASRSKFFFGSQGQAISRIRDLCLPPIRIHSLYLNEWLYVSLGFPKTQSQSARLPSMPMLQMYHVLYDWSITPEQGFFFDQKLLQDIDRTLNCVRDVIVQSMSQAKKNEYAQEEIKAKKEEEARVREQERLARQKAEKLRQEQLAEARQEKTEWLCKSVDELLGMFPLDTGTSTNGSPGDDKTLRSQGIRTLVMVLAEDHGLYSKDVGFTQSEVWTIVTDHWAKKRPSQAAEARAEMYKKLNLK